MTWCNSVLVRVTQSLRPDDPGGLCLPQFGSISFVIAFVLLLSLSNLVPKVSRKDCVCFRLFVHDFWSCDWDIGRVLWEEFLSAPIHSPPLPPLYTPIRSFNWYQSLVKDHSTIIGFVIHRATKEKGHFCLRIWFAHFELAFD